jgi:hypothetical protein
MQQLTLQTTSSTVFKYGEQNPDTNSSTLNYNAQPPPRWQQIPIALTTALPAASDTVQE